jgi:hypothetical protein
MDVLHHDLEAVKATRLRHLHLLHEANGEILENNAIRGREEGEDVLDEVLVARGEGLPVLGVRREVDLLSRPERSLCSSDEKPLEGVRMSVWKGEN